MLIFSFIIVFKGLHGLIKKIYIYTFVVLHIAAAPLFTLCVELSILATVRSHTSVQSVGSRTCAVTR